MNKPSNQPRNYWLAPLLYLGSVGCGLSLAIIPVLYWIYRFFTDQ